MRDRPGLAAGDVLLAVTTLSFDISVLELFLPLVVGATVVMVGPEVAADGAALRVDRVVGGDGDAGHADDVVDADRGRVGGRRGVEGVVWWGGDVAGSGRSSAGGVRVGVEHVRSDRDDGVVDGGAGGGGWSGSVPIGRPIDNTVF